MQLVEHQFYAPDIAAKAVIELTTALQHYPRRGIRQSATLRPPYVVEPRPFGVVRREYAEGEAGEGAGGAQFANPGIPTTGH